MACWETERGQARVRKEPPQVSLISGGFVITPNGSNFYVFHIGFYLNGPNILAGDL